jgi:hypothetical protein
MQPGDLRAESFAHYPPQAHAFAVAHLAVLRQIPLSLLPILLREIIDYDWRFPVEQRVLVRQLDYLGSLPQASFAALMAPFAAVRLPKAIGKIDWVNQPQHFSEQLSALLWSMQQMDQYRAAALEYEKNLRQVLVEPPPAVPRFAIALIGQGVAHSDRVLFRQLRPQGTLFTAVKPDRGLDTLIAFVNDRARKHPVQYGHWYIDGGEPAPGCGAQQGITLTSYSALAPAALRELNLTSHFVAKATSGGAVGPEAMQSFMAGLTPTDIGLHGSPAQAPLRHFEVKVLTEGAGTQVFSTTFVQWTAREAMRRAQPLTLFARFAPRQRMAPMNELLKRDPLTQATDPEGSLIDADMGAYYTWINQQRLPGAERSCFLAWYEGHNIAVAIGPDLAKGTVSDVPTDLQKILGWMS